MRRRTRLLAVLATASALGLIVLGGIASSALAKPRGNSGLPPGPGNPLAALQQQINELAAKIAILTQAGVQWINHQDLVTGNANATMTVGSGLIIGSSVAPNDVVVEKGLQVPPNFVVTGVRVCYVSSNAATFISQIQLGQVQDPPSSTLAVFTDDTDQASISAVCVDTTPATSIDPTLGAVLLSLTVHVQNPGDTLTVLALGLNLAPAS